MRVVFLCPFNLDRLTGTPIRARTIISAVSQNTDVSVISQQFSAPASVITYNLGSCSLLMYTWRSLSSLKKIHPEVVHGITTASVPALLSYKYFCNWHVRLVFEMHGWAWFEMAELRGIFLRVIFLLCDLIGLNSADRIIVMSNTQKIFVSTKTLSPHRITVIWGPVDSIPQYLPIVLRREVRVGYAGNALWWQGLQYIIGAAAILVEEKHITFHLAGFDSSDSSQFPQLSSIVYYGRLERDQVFSFLTSCDVLISPRVTGGVSDLQFPHKLSEYLSAGRPVITSSASDQPLIVCKNSCGLVVDPLNAETLAKAISSFSRLSLEERDAMGRRAHQFAERNLSLPVLAQKLMHIYGSLS